MPHLQARERSTISQLSHNVPISQGYESLFKIGDERFRISGLDDHIIHVSFDVLVELSLETGLV
jgi:hypothetical protein